MNIQINLKSRIHIYCSANLKKNHKYIKFKSDIMFRVITAFVLSGQCCCLLHNVQHHLRVTTRKHVYFFLSFFVLSLSTYLFYVQRVITASDHTQRQPTLGRTPFDEGLTRHRDFYLTKHNIHMTQTSILLARFEPAIPANERPQTHALNSAVTGIG